MKTSFDCSSQWFCNFAMDTVENFFKLQFYIKGYMNEFVFRDVDKGGFKKAFEHCKKWCSEHQAEIGLAEMALGATLIAFGLQTGDFDLGKDVVGTDFSTSGLTGASAGSGIAGIGGYILGSIGIAGAYTFAIPAFLLIGGGMSILGAAGYAVGDIAGKLLTPELGFLDIVASGSLLAVGVALIVDGGRRVVTDTRVLKVASKFANGVLQLAKITAKVLVRTMEELQRIVIELAKNPTADMTTVATASAGAAIGGGLAAGSVSVLGSHALGVVALSLGLVSAPVWPVIAGGAAGLALGVAAWKGVKNYKNNKN